MEEQISFTARIKRVVLSTEPCGTPFSRTNSREVFPLADTLDDLFVKKFFRKDKMFPDRFIFSSCLQITDLKAVSKALSTSKITATTSCLTLKASAISV